MHSICLMLCVLRLVWPFSEEILNSAAAIWLSNDGYLMLYGTFNDSAVDEQHFAWYGTASGTTAGNAYLYPEIRSLR